MNGWKLQISLTNGNFRCRSHTRTSSIFEVLESFSKVGRETNESNTKRWYSLSWQKPSIYDEAYCRLLAFLHEHVPTVLGFFHFRLLSILQYLPTVCRSIQQPFASPHSQTSILPIIRNTRLTRPSINKVACLSSCMYLYFTGNRMHREAYDPALQAACSTASVSRMPRNKARSQSSAG